MAVLKIDAPPETLRPIAVGVSNTLKVRAVRSRQSGIDRFCRILATQFFANDGGYLVSLDYVIGSVNFCWDELRVPLVLSLCFTRDVFFLFAGQNCFGLDARSSNWARILSFCLGAFYVDM